MLPVLEIIEDFVTAHLVIVHRNNLLLVIYYRIGFFDEFYGLPRRCLRFVLCILIFVTGLRSEIRSEKLLERRIVQTHVNEVLATIFQRHGDSRAIFLWIL
jgi:hypothetical protein